MGIVPIVFIGLAEAGLAASVATGHVPVAGAVVVHAALALACGIAAYRGGDAALGAACGLAVLFAGAVGAAGAAFLVVHVARARTKPAAEREAWYRRLRGDRDGDPVSRLCADLAAGRAFDPGRAHAVRFVRIARAGSLAQQQALVGRICQGYDPAFWPVLASLLRSPRAAVRASAAAALARLREGVRAVTSPELVYERRSSAELLIRRSWRTACGWDHRSTWRAILGSCNGARPPIRRIAQS
jgi:hypothetical protein